MRSWCKSVAWLLDLHSYLLGDGNGQQIPDEQQRNAEAAAPVPQADGLGAAHQAFLLREGPTGKKKLIYFLKFILSVSSL